MVKGSVNDRGVRTFCLKTTVIQEHHPTFPMRLCSFAKGTLKASSVVVDL